MASEYVIELNNDNFTNEINSPQPVLVDFWAPWCGPCRMMSPVIEEIAAEAQGRYKVCKINVDENSEITMQYKVLSIPTLFVFKDGKELESIVGVRSKDDILDTLTKYA